MLLVLGAHYIKYSSLMEQYLMYQEVALVYLPPHHLLPRGLIAQLVEHHTGDEVVGSISPLKSQGFFVFFSSEKDLGTCIQVLLL